MSFITRTTFRLLQIRNSTHSSCRIRQLSTKTEATLIEEESDKSKQTHFGFKTVNEEEKWKKG